MDPPATEANSFFSVGFVEASETAPPPIVSIVIPQPTISSPPLGSWLLNLPAGMDPQTNLYK